MYISCCVLQNISTCVVLVEGERAYVHASGASNGHRLTTAVLHGLTCNALPNHDCWISWDPPVTVFHFPNVRGR